MSLRNLVSFLFALFFLAPAAWAVDATTITFDSDKTAPGFCYDNPATACTVSAVDCNDETWDYCVTGYCTDDSTVVCHGDGDCVGTCTNDVTWTISCHATGVAGTACDVGTFISGEPWVNKAAKPSGKVWLVSKAPEHTLACEPGETGTCLHGWDVDRDTDHGLDGRGGYVGGQYARVTPATFPYDATPVSADPEDAVSITAAVSGRLLDNPTACSNASNSCLENGGTLTILGAAPPANAFRPPPFSTKPATYWTASDVDTSLVPALDVTQVTPPLTIPEAGVPFQRFHPAMRGFGSSDSERSKYWNSLWQVKDAPGSSLRAKTYHALAHGAILQSILRLSMDDANWGTQSHLDALYYMVQLGIDNYWINTLYDVDETADVPRKNGRGASVAFAAQVLNDSAMQAAVNVGDNGLYGHLTIINDSAKAGRPIWGGETRCSPTDYYAMMQGPGKPNNWCGDPFGWIDQHWTDGQGGDGVCGTNGCWFDFEDYSYQRCCSTDQYYGFGPLAKIVGTWFTEGQKMFGYADHFRTGGDGTGGDVGGYHHESDPCNNPSENETSGGAKDGVAGTDWGHDTTAGDDIDDSDGYACWMDGTCTCIQGGTETGRGLFHEDSPSLQNRVLWLRDVFDAYRDCLVDRSCVGIPADASSGGNIQGISITQNEGD